MHFVHLLIAAAFVCGSTQSGTSQAAGSNAQAGSNVQSGSSQAGSSQTPSARAPAAPAAVSASTRKEGADGKRVQFTTEDKLTLVGSYYAPKDPKKLAPLAVLVPDAGGKRGDLAELADKLQKQGFAVLSIDLRAHGESAGIANNPGKPWAELSDAEKLATWKLARGDVKAAVKFITEQPGVQKANLALLGDRAGCTLITDHAKQDESVRSIVMVDPPSAETLGFNLERDVASLGGLATFIAVTNETRGKADDLARTGEKANNGNPFIDVAVFKGVSLAPVIDKGLPTSIAKFMDANANHKKGDQK